MKLKIKASRITIPVDFDGKCVTIKLFDEEWTSIGGGNIIFEEPHRTQRIFAASLLTFRADIPDSQIYDAIPGMIEDFKKNVCEQVMGAEIATSN